VPPEALALLEPVLIPGGDAAAKDQGVALEEVFRAGCKQLGLAAPDALESLPKFQRFKELVESKGFFEGLEPGSDEYQEKYEKLKAKFLEKHKASTVFDADGETTPVGGDGDLRAEADEELAMKHKEDGNEFLKRKEFEKAVEAYSSAIDANPTGPHSHIFYANRAAAYMQMQELEKCADDCTMAVTLDPSYVKAYIRLASATQKLGRTEEAKENANRALELEPENESAKKILASVNTGGSFAGGEMPGMPGMPGGMGGLTGMMNNPAMREMASKMMQDPQMMQMAQNLMSDPDAMSKMMQMMGGGGGMPGSN